VVVLATVVTVVGLAIPEDEYVMMVEGINVMKVVKGAKVVTELTIFVLVGILIEQLEFVKVIVVVGTTAPHAVGVVDKVLLVWNCVSEQLNIFTVTVSTEV
jgi:hypothetical protein